jgi:hypothetical protein
MSKHSVAVGGRDTAPRGTRTTREGYPPPRSGATAQERQYPQTGRRTSRPWWRGPWPLIGTVFAVLALVGIFVVLGQLSNASDSAQIDKPVTSSIVQQVTGVSPAVIAKVGAGTLATGDPLPSALRAISGPALPLVNGKPQLLYIGADFCPVCATSRWSLISALSRFGTFSGLRYMRSAPNDGDLASFTFHGSRYSSPYLSFVAVENADRAGQVLDPLTHQQQQLLSTLGGNGYPFVDIAGRYINRAPNAYVGGFDPSLLSGKDWAQIAATLSNASDPVTQGMIGSANDLTAAICRITYNQPNSACANATIRTMQQRLPQP